MTGNSLARLAMLEKMCEQRPDDPFPRYGLAMELKKLGRKDEACTRFAALAAAHPDYLPTYLMGGGLLGELGRTDEAADLFARGILVARAQGNEHALGELTAAKAQLPR